MEREKKKNAAKWGVLSLRWRRHSCAIRFLLGQILTTEVQLFILKYAPSLFIQMLLLYCSFEEEKKKSKTFAWHQQQESFSAPFIDFLSYTHSLFLFVFSTSVTGTFFFFLLLHSFWTLTPVQVYYWFLTLFGGIQQVILEVLTKLTTFIFFFPLSAFLVSVRFLY